MATVATLKAKQQVKSSTSKCLCIYFEVKKKRSKTFNALTM